MSAPICPTLDAFLRVRATTLPTFDLLQLEIPEADQDSLARHLRERQALARMLIERAKGPAFPTAGATPNATPKGSNDG